MAQGVPPSPTGPAVSGAEVLAILEQLSTEIRELDVGNAVPRVPNLTAVEFLREYVGPNKPVVLTDATSHWPAHELWTDDYLLQTVGDVHVTVALTPNGRADAVTPLPLRPCSASGAPASSSGGGGGGSGGGQPRECFALPYQCRMRLRDFLRLFYSSKGCTAQRGQQRAGEGVRTGEESLPQEKQQQQQLGEVVVREGEQLFQQQQEGQQQQEQQQPVRVVPYLQFQNSSLLAELPQLLQDVDEHMPFCTEALGCLPEAINIWIGDERSVTSWHKDPFENIYAVVSGSKTFTLLPPADVYRMRLRRYPLATFAPQGAPGADVAAAGGAAAGCGGEAGGRLAPVLHEPREEVLWSSVQPEDGWAAAAASGSTEEAGGSQCDPRDEGAAGGSVPPASSGGTGGGWAGDLFADPRLPRPLRVTVRAGEAIYLPAMWWHQVEQQADETGRVIAVNYWYDMRHDAKFAYYEAVERLAAAAGLVEHPPGAEC